MGGEPCERIEFSKVARKERSESRGCFPDSITGGSIGSYAPFHPGYKQRWPEIRMDTASQGMPCRTASAVRLVARHLRQL